jgi:hypothetical protein
MSKKHNFLISLIVLFSIAAMSSAADFLWDDQAGDHNWNNATNWNPDTVPPSTSGNYAKILISTGPTLSPGQTATPYRVYLDGSNGSMTIDGGTINLTSSWIGIGYTSASDSGTLTMNSGTINASGTSGHLYCAVDGTGTLNMSGGAINLAKTLYVGRDPTGVGIINLSGGTITCDVLAIGSVGGTGIINFTGTGKLVIAGDVTAQIATCVANGQIKAYGGAGVVMKDFDVTTSGKTTVWGIASYKALTPSPEDNTTDVAVSGTNLTWKLGLSAVSHNVYLGTVSNDVNNAQRSPGDLDGDGIVDFKDVLRLTDYWLLDPIGSEPYAGVNGDSTVDFIDYALLAQDWKNTAAPIFKGNQDTNSYNPGTLAFATTYYWRVDEVNGPDTTKGDLWSFTTQTGKATFLTPADNETDVLSRAVLAWTPGIGATSHDVYLGTTNPPVTLVSDNQTETTYNPGGTLDNSTTYYWRIDENYGATTIQGDVWSFTTIDEADEPNFVVVHITDVQLGMCPEGDQPGLWQSAVSKINNINPDFVIDTGDHVQDWSNKPMIALYKSIAAGISPTIPLYHLAGNHDVGDSPTAARYVQYLAEFPNGDTVPWYYFTYGNNIFICLESNVLRNPFSGQDVVEINWLTDTLADADANGFSNKLVFMHHPLFVHDVNEIEERSFPEPRRTELRTIFHTYNVAATFSGHTHTNAYVLDGDLECVTTTSTTCGLGSPATTPAITIIKVYSDHIVHELHNLDSLP